ncbi:MAG: MarR family transcriptional regulator [Victivallales bacterium]|nr:MarR family transcriptional regulator [Victivallales bacterium]
MDNQAEIDLIEAFLKKTLTENGLIGHFNGRSRNGETIFVSQSGLHVIIFFRTALSVNFVERTMREMATKLSQGGHLMFVATRISQQLIDSQNVKGVHFFSPDGFSRIRLPGFTYIVHPPVTKVAIRMGNAGSAFVGKASIIPRLFFKEPERIWLQGELAEEANLTRAYISIVIRRMVAAGYIRQEGKGYRLQSPEQMLDDWVAVYRFDRYVKRQEFAMSFQHLREGMDKLTRLFSEKSMQFAMMGPCGAYLRCPYMEPSVVTTYVSELVEDLPGLYPVERDGNVVLYLPANKGFFVGTNKIEGIPVVSALQLYLDLKKMPGRSGDQADYLRENLLNWSE